MMGYNTALCKIFFFVSLNICLNAFCKKMCFKNRPLMMNNVDNHDVSIAEHPKRCVISSKNKKSFCDNDAIIYINENQICSDKKLITVSPGGFKGFYLLGILTFMKENYNLDNCIFSGASAGAWNSLFMCYQGKETPLNFVYKFLDENIRKTKSITELQYYLKYKILSSYKSTDFDLSRLFIGVTTFKSMSPCINIYSDFEDIEDAINCCMASSHIPFITGGLSNRYKNMFSFDGGFSTYPYLNKERILHVSLSMWDKLNEDSNTNTSSFKRNIKTIKRFSDFFSISKNNLLELFDNGYQDAKNNQHIFDNVLERIEEDTPEF